MDDAGAVRGVEGFGHLFEQGKGPLRGQTPLTMEAGAQGLARQEFHGQEDGGGRGRSVCGVARQIEDPADVGMGDLAGKLDLLLEAGDRARMSAAIAGSNVFQRDGSLQLQVFGLVDLAHAAAA